jgi:hypothetical protein
MATWWWPDWPVPAGAAGARVAWSPWSESARAARACRRLLCSAVGGVSMRIMRGGRRARRMVVRLTKGGWAPMRWRVGRCGGVSSRAAASLRQRGSPTSDRRRTRWHRLGGRGEEGHHRSARRSEGGTGGRLEWLGDVRTSVVGGRCRPMASGMLRLPTRTRGSGENCRGARRASPGEESAVREREKKGGTTVMGWHPFIGWRGGVEAGGGGPAGSGTTRREEERGGVPGGEWREGGGVW